MRKLMITSGWLLSVASFIVGGLLVVGASGRYNLKRQAVSYAAEKENTPQAAAASSSEVKKQQKGWIVYKGHNYRYNNAILTFLLMGIDEKKKADTLFLLVLNPHKKVINLIPINSDSMTAIAVYDDRGIQEDTLTAQIGIQYMFGEGNKTSCEYQIEAVSNFMGGISINGYLAVDMDVIPEVIEMIDGADQEIPEDVTADGRFARQIYLLTELISRIKQLTEKDFTVPVKIYSQVSDRVITDITADEVVYLAAVAGGYRFDSGQVIMIPGKSAGREEDMDSDYDEFYVDGEALYELILDVFYEPVN